MTPDATELAWYPSGARLAERLEQPDLWPAVLAWCKDLQRRAEARVAQLTQEETTRRENKTLEQRVVEAVDKALEKRRRRAAEGQRRYR